MPPYGINHKITGAKPTPEYRRAYVPGGTFFLTLATVEDEIPFEIEIAVVLTEHIHFHALRDFTSFDLWTF